MLWAVANGISYNSLWLHLIACHCLALPYGNALMNDKRFVSRQGLLLCGSFAWFAMCSVARHDSRVGE